MKAISNSLLITLAILLTALPGYAQKNKWGSGVEGKGEVVEKNIQLDRFDAIKLGVAADVVLHQGSSQKVMVKGQQNIIDLLKTEVNDGEWKIGFSENTRNYKELTIHITVPTLKSVKVAGSGDVRGEDAFSTSGDFYAGVFGSGNLELDISAANIEAAIKGSGDMDLKGKASRLNVQIQGSGDFDADQLKVADCAVKISGSGNCKVHASGNLDVDISGSGNVRYQGDPSVKSKIRGSGDVHKGR